jgi:hypothetical protein
MKQARRRRINLCKSIESSGRQPIGKNAQCTMVNDQCTMVNETEH